MRANLALLALLAGCNAESRVNVNAGGQIQIEANGKMFVGGDGTGAGDAGGGDLAAKIDALYTYLGVAFVDGALVPLPPSAPPPAPIAPPPAAPVKCKFTYYRVFPKSNPDSYFILDEMDFFMGGSEVPTTAATGEPICSSTQGGGGCAALTDGSTGDSSTSGHWHSTAGANGHWAGFHSNEPTEISGYAMHSAVRYGTSSYVPDDWVFEGSDDGSSWETLDDVSGYSWSSKTVTRNPITACE